MTDQRPSTVAGGGSILSTRLLAALTWTAGVYFVARLVYFVLAIDHTVPPDEVTHFDRVQYFSEFLLLPAGTPEEGHGHLWASRYRPPLYYIFAAKLLALNVFPLDGLVYTRLIGVFLNCLTVFFGWRFIREISPKPLVHFLFLIMMTNTLMFSFLSAAVTYDSVSNLAAAAAFVYLAVYFKTASPRALLCLFVALFVATLTKTAMLPFCFAAAAAVLLHEGRHLKARASDLVASCYSGRPAARLLFAAAALLAILNVLLYGNNLVQFGHLVPRAAQVLDESDIQLHPISARESIYVGFLKGDLTQEAALERARQIEDPAVSRDIMNLVNYGAWRLETEGPFEPISRLAYFRSWAKLMLYSTYGIMANSVLYKSFAGYVPYIIVLAVAGLFFAVRGLQRHVPAYEFVFLGMFAFYALVLMQAVNYRAYLEFQLPHISVQGRYLFPFLVPVYGLAAKYLLSFGSERAQSLIVVATALYFVYADFPFFLAYWGSGPW